ncbi:sensor histidine kinase [Halalkalibacterium halodurans]|uniref:sensor histidine kinase n=1 Tax=Halalkalibacterium halodurans TaxID=86665 RepID=UPI002E21CC14|nr:sensor histidine kinase [Halalkalibacterium halodurans]
MIRIRTKLLAYFLVLLVILIAVSYFLYASNQRTLYQYNESFERFLVLNDISQTTNQIYETLNQYVTEETPDLFEEYSEQRSKLITIQQQIEKLIRNERNAVHLKNYDHMVTSFLEKTEQAAEGFDEQRIDAYPFYLDESQQIAQYIREMTLTLIDDELTNYQQFYNSMLQKHSYTTQLAISIFVSILVLSSFFAIWLSDGITKPISRLTNAAYEISSGQLDGKDVKVSSNDELAFLTETFNDMRQNISGLVKEMEETSRLNQLLKEMELRSLQSQINPHFLFNTLNVILKMSYIEQAEKTGKLIASVSSLLRYNLGSLDRTTTVDDEANMLQEYFHILKARFGDWISLSLNVDDEARPYLIPCLTLQPLVENAFIHGVEQMESGAAIDVTIQKVGDSLTISISDNGAGMDEATRKELLSSKEEDQTEKRASGGHSTGIGMRNVMRRLEIFYQKTELLTIESSLGEGTTVSLLLPTKEVCDD